MASGFLIVYTAKTWNLPNSQAGAYGIVMQVGLAVSNLFFGFLADRKGHKLSLEISLLLNVLSLLLAIFTPTPAWFYLVFFLRGAVMAGTLISRISIVYEFTGRKIADLHRTGQYHPGCGGCGSAFDRWVAGRGGGLPMDVYPYRHHRYDQPVAAALHGPRTTRNERLDLACRAAAFWWVRPAILEINDKSDIS